MRGELNKQQVENLLLSQVVGRIACCSKGRPYIVPVTYVYDGEYIYGQMQEGKKLELLRKNKHICFETDIMTDMANWKSVVITGMFEELSDEKAEAPPSSTSTTSSASSPNSPPGAPDRGHRNSPSPHAASRVIGTNLDKSQGSGPLAPGNARAQK